MLLALTDDDDAVPAFKACDVELERLRFSLADFLDRIPAPPDRVIDADPTDDFKRVIQRAAIHVQSSGRNEVTGANVLIALFSEAQSEAVRCLKEKDLNRLDVVNYVSHGIDKARRRPTPPAVPAQTVSPHFTIQDGFIQTIPTQFFAGDENDYLRLNSLHAPLLNAARNAEQGLSQGNVPFASILDVLNKYLKELDKEVGLINYAVLYAYGLQLQVTCDNVHALVERGELPELNEPAASFLKTSLQLHGPFILSSKDGRDLVTDAERYERSPKEERDFQAKASEFANRLTARVDIIEPSTAEFVHDVTRVELEGSQLERRYALKAGTVRNLVIVLSAGALVASTASIPMIGPYVAVSLGLLTLESLKKSRAFNELSAPIKDRLDGLGELELGHLRQIPRDQLMRIKDFLMENRDLLREVGGESREMQWFREVIDWISENDEEEQADTAEKR